MAKTKEQIAETAKKNREEKIEKARKALAENKSLRGYLSAQPHPFDAARPRSVGSLGSRSLLTYYEWGLKKARHYKQYEIAKDIFRLPVANLEVEKDDSTLDLEL